MKDFKPLKNEERRYYYGIYCNVSNRVLINLLN